MLLYYDKQTQVFSTDKTETNEAVFESSNRIGSANGKFDPALCGNFRFQIRTNFYPKAPHREYILIDIFINDVLLLPISLAFDNGKFSKDRISIAQYGFDHYRLYMVGIRSPHTIVLWNQNKDWLPDYSDAWRKALNEVCFICNNREWMYEETRMLIESISKLDLESKPWHMRTLLELTNNWYKASPKVTQLLQPILDKYCYERMVSLINKIQNHDDPSNADINIAELVKNGNLYWNHIKSHAISNSEEQNIQARCQ